jgi:predicted nucleic acid-binding protein
VLCYPEGRAALGAAHRASRLTASAYTDAIADFEDLHSELMMIDVDRSLADEAGDLAAHFGLRGYDAVHLASAMSFGEVTVVSWDHELVHAALANGCSVAPAP